MKLKRLRISNFQSFGVQATEIELRKSTFLIGPNGAGKTAVLQALGRMFAIDQRYRGIRLQDFHRTIDEEELTEPKKLWIEAEFTIPEAAEDDLDAAAVPPCFHHMKLEEADGVPLLRIRLDATLHPDDEIEESLSYVTEQDDDLNPVTFYPVPRTDRHYIQMHYLPARRDPADHIAYTASALLGRFLKAAEWSAEKETLCELNGQIQQSLTENGAIKMLTKKIGSRWKQLHKGEFFKKPSISFGQTDIERILRLLSVTFSPSHHQQAVEFTRLSDGQKSLLYLSLVLASHSICRQVLKGQNTSFDAQKLKPPIHTIVAIEEPENSLSPHYLGRVVTSLTDFGKKVGAQVLIATHSPSILRRIDPRHIRYLRLDGERKSVVSKIILPGDDSVEGKYIREAVQAFPEIYFSRLVILGEGDTEEIVLHRMLKAGSLSADDTSISVAPLGGRHVNHFWRLLNELNIPHVTLLDLDLGRFGGGWGRIKYAYKQLKAIGVDIEDDYINSLQPWSSESTEWEEDLPWLEENGVFFSDPLDADFMMLTSYPDAYEITDDKKVAPSATTIKSVLGKKHNTNDDLFSTEELEYFSQYQKKFKLNSKPASHFQALANVTDEDLNQGMPPVLVRLFDMVKNKLNELPE